MRSLAPSYYVPFVHSLAVLSMERLDTMVSMRSLAPSYYNTFCTQSGSARHADVGFTVWYSLTTVSYTHLTLPTKLSV